MAEAFLKVVVDNLGSLTKEEMGLILGVEEEMKKLSSTLTTIQAVMEDAQVKQMESRPIRDWLRKLNVLAYEMDDILDECKTHVSKVNHAPSKFSRYGLKIAKTLVEKQEQEMSVIPTIGVGGLGKTTLAQLVFDERIWVCAVSDNFELKTLVKAMIESATGSGRASDAQHLDALERRLWELLSQKRYLVVLDDVWNDPQEKWFELKDTHHPWCVAQPAHPSSSPHAKRRSLSYSSLPDGAAGRAFRRRAFGPEEEEDEYPELEVIGKQIVHKCAV